MPADALSARVLLLLLLLLLRAGGSSFPGSESSSLYPR